MSTSTPPRAPRHLDGPGRDLFRHVVESYDLEPADIAVLVTACEALSRTAQARTLVDVEGVVIKDRFDVAKAHPAIAVERDARTSFLRAMRQLGLDAAGAPLAAKDTPRMPPLRGGRR